MAIVVAFISQKGGAGKSTLARALAREIAAGGKKVLIADLDEQQQTSALWAERRQAAGIDPAVEVRTFGSVGEALAAIDDEFMVILDGPARASAGTLEIAKAAQLVVQPCGATTDDMDPAIRVFHKLVKAGIAPGKLAFALFRTGSAAQEREARCYLSSEFVDPAGGKQKLISYHVLEGALPNKVGYANALDGGYTVTETKWETMNEEAAAVIRDLVKWMMVAHRKGAAA